MHQRLEHQQSEDQDATIERREKHKTFVNDSKFILTEKGPLISNTIKSTPMSNEIH